MGEPATKNGRQLADGLLEIYKVAVEMADRLSARRAAASSFFITAQSALIALVAAGSNQHWAFALPGLVLAGTWWLLLRSYRQLSAEKYNVIQTIEKELPAAPFTDEWNALKQPSGPFRWGRYHELGLLERVVPVVFAAIFIVILATDPA